ncbi:MAG TPA: DUF6600 domain-containing protein [Vicinamibacterales bacterium]
MGFRISTAIAIAAWLSVSATARAQDQLDAAPPHLAVVDGAATLERDGQAETATPGMPYIAGDRLRTERGRVEILFPDGSALDVDEVSSVDLQDAGLLRILGGRVLLTVARANGAPATRYQMDTPSGSAAVDGPGEYRLAVLNGAGGLQTELAVLRGSAALTTELGSQPLRAGERSMASVNGAPSYPQPFNSARFDAFDRWASAQRDLRLGSSASAQYLPPDLQMYGGTFDRNGSWAYEASYGNVWYPSVSPGWRPYYDGYFDPLPRFGWTWIGTNVWSWPTHHYGRWGYAHSRWFWIPGHQWAPAWVHWGTAPGYVGWCPLGFDNRPVFSLSASYTNYWANGWVVMPRPYFGAHGGYVHRYAVSPRMLPVNTPFVEHAAPPVLPRAVPRASIAGIRSAPRGYAVPRTTTSVGRSGAATAAPPRSALDRRYGTPAAPSSAPSNASSAPLREPRAPERRPQIATPGRAFPTPQQVPMFAAPRTVPPEVAIRRPSPGATTPPPVNTPRSAETPSVVPRPATPRYAPRVERTPPAAAAPAPPQLRGLATPRSSAPAATPAPSSGQADRHAQGRADSSRGNTGGVSAGSRRPR